jgi:hypothetical protein
MLILYSNVTGCAGSPEAVQASYVGLVSVVLDDAVRATMSAADFCSSRAIILWDPRCSLSRSLRPSRFTTAEVNQAVLGQEFDGIVIRSDST